MSRIMKVGFVAAAAASVTAVAVYLATLAEEYRLPVGPNRWIVWATAAGVALAVLGLFWLARAVVRRASPERKKAAEPGLSREFLVGVAVLLVLATAAVGSHLVPEQMAVVEARNLDRKEIKDDLGEKLGQRDESFGRGKVELRRLALVGRRWRAVLFETVVPGLVRSGMVRYPEAVERRLLERGWLPSPSPAHELRFVVKTQEERKELEALRAEIREVADEMAQKQKTTGVGFVGAFVAEYARQADMIVIGLDEGELQTPAAVTEFSNAVMELSLAEQAVRGQTGAARAAAVAELRKSGPANWARMGALEAAARKAVSRQTDGELLRAVLRTLADAATEYADLAKESDWWAKDKVNLKGQYEALLKGLPADNGLLEAQKNKAMVPVAEGLAELARALKAALKSDRPGDGPKPGGGDAADPREQWDARMVLAFVESRLGMDGWENAPLKKYGDRGLIDCIKARWQEEFLLPPPKVSWQTHSKEQAVKYAQRIVVLFIKDYAAQMADEWEQRVKAVNDAKGKLVETPAGGFPVAPAFPAANAVYPVEVRRQVRALFTEDGFWASHLAELKALLAEVKYPSADVDVGTGSSAGRVNRAVEGNRMMAEEFVKALRVVADEKTDIDDPTLQVGGVWWTIFYAGNGKGPGPVNPFATLMRIRLGLPIQKPVDDAGKPIRRPDGQLDWSKAKGPTIGGVKELGGDKFLKELEAPEGLPPAAPARPVAGGPGGTKNPGPDTKE